jgi:hypothetical protein
MRRYIELAVIFEMILSIHLPLHYTIINQRRYLISPIEPRTVRDKMMERAASPYVNAYAASNTLYPCA